MKEVNEAMEEIPESSEDRQHLLTLLLKVRGFIAKVSFNDLFIYRASVLLALASSNLG